MSSHIWFSVEKSHTITFTVDRKTGEVFQAILDLPQKMFPKAIKKDDGWWMFKGPYGDAKLKFDPNKELGILDHVYEDSEAKWNVPMRVVSNGDFCEVIVTLFKPDHFSDEQFNQRMKEMEKVVEQMKIAIEN